MAQKADETTTPNTRLLFQGWQDPHRRPHGCNDMYYCSRSRRPEDPRRVGPLQAARHRLPDGRSVQSHSSTRAAPAVTRLKMICCVPPLAGDCGRVRARRICSVPTISAANKDGGHASLCPPYTSPSPPAREEGELVNVKPRFEGDV